MPILLAAVIICVILLVVYLISSEIRIFQRYKRSEELQERDKDKVQYAFVINPSKPHAAEIREQISQYCQVKNIHNITFIETQLDKDGGVCAQEALDQGADVVVAVGGDGTIRTVASALANTTHAMGIIPIGTGNLFARNLSIPVDDVEAALTIVTSHGSRYVDVGKIHLLDRKIKETHAFLVIAGAGFDALMIDDTNPRLKKNISWLAYFISGMKNLFADKARGSLTYIDKNDNSHTQNNVTFRTVLAGNCGEIPVFSLLPDAQYDDGIIDLAIIDTTAGLFGWANLFVDVVHQTITGKPKKSPISTNSKIDHIQVRQAQIKLVKPTLVQVDGDLLGKTSHLGISVSKQALCVRCPSQFSSLEHAPDTNIS